MKNWSVNSDQQAFFELLRAGLWEKEARLSQFDGIDYAAIMQLAEEQSVVGLVTAGLEHVADVKVPQTNVLQFVGSTMQIEQRNRAMNSFIEELIDNLRRNDVYTLLVKGQGIAQCYEKPLWRSCGDVDLLLSKDNYEKAKTVLLPLASSVEEENKRAYHLGLTLSGWTVELHGTLRSTILSKMDATIDNVQNDVFYNGNVRSWLNGNTLVFLPSPDNDVFFVFTHILKHFFRGGIGLRQVCDWIRLLWKYRDSMDVQLLEKRLRRAGLMTEWKAFAALAVDKLRMPADALPFYSPEKKWKRKSDRICSFIKEVGNFGHNRDNNYYRTTPFVTRKAISFGRRLNDLLNHISVFPLDSMRVLGRMMRNGLNAAVRGE